MATCNPIKTSSPSSQDLKTSDVSIYDGSAFSCVQNIISGTSSLNDVIVALERHICGLTNPNSSEIKYDGSIELGSCNIPVTPAVNPTVNDAISSVADYICTMETTINTRIDNLTTDSITLSGSLIGSDCIGTFTGSDTLEVYLSAMAAEICAIPPAQPQVTTNLYDYESITRGDAISTGRTWTGIGGDATYSAGSLEVDITAPGGTSRYYIDGEKYEIADTSGILLSSSSDNYLDVENVGGGAYNVVSVALGSPEPSVGNGYHRIAKFVTDGTGVTSYEDKRVLYYQDGERWFDNAVITRHITDLNVTGAKLEDFGTAGLNDWSLASITLDTKGRVQSWTNNTTITSLSDKDILQYDGGTGEWVNVNLTSAAIVAGATQGQTLYWDNGGLQWTPDSFLRNMPGAVGIGVTNDPIVSGLQIGYTSDVAFEMATVSSINTATGSSGSLAGNTYYYTVTAIDAGGGETLADTEQSQTIDGVAQTDILVSWTEVPLATKYRVYRGTTTLTYTEYWEVDAGVQSYLDDGTAGTAGSPPATTPNAFSFGYNTGGMAFGAGVQSDAVIRMVDKGQSVQYGLDIAITGTQKSLDTTGVKSVVTATSGADNIGGWFSVDNGINNYVLRVEDGNNNTGKFLQVLDAAGNVGFQDASITVWDESVPVLSDVNVLNFIGGGVVASSPAPGQIDIQITGSVSALDDLTDVSAAAANDWDTLAYDAGLGLWVTSGTLSNDLTNVSVGEKPGTIDARLHINSTSGADLLKINNSIAGTIVTIDAAGVMNYREQFQYTFTNGGASPLGAGKVLTSDGAGNATWETVTSSQDLQAVTNVGNTTTNDIVLVNSDLVFNNGSFTTTFSANPTANRAINLPDEDGTVALGTGAPDKVTRWLTNNTITESSFFDDGTTTAFGVAPSSTERINIIANNTNTIKIDHTGSNAGSKILDMDYTGTAALDGIVELNVASGAGGAGLQKGIKSTMLSTAGTYVYAIQGQSSNAVNRNVGVYGSANNSFGDDIGLLAGANTSDTTLMGVSYISAGIVASGGVGTNVAGDAVGGIINATATNPDDNYGIHVVANNAGAGTSYIGRFDDNRTTGTIGDVLTSIDANGTAEWSTITGTSIGLISGSGTTFSTNKYDWVGALTQDADITGASATYDVRLGTAGDNIAVFDVNAVSGTHSYLSGGVGLVQSKDPSNFTNEITLATSITNMNMSAGGVTLRDRDTGFDTQLQLTDTGGVALTATDATSSYLLNVTKASSAWDVMHVEHGGGDWYIGGASGVGGGGSNMIHQSKFNVASSVVWSQRDFGGNKGLEFVTFTTTGGLVNYTSIESANGDMYLITGSGHSNIHRSDNHLFQNVASSSLGEWTTSGLIIGAAGTAKSTLDVEGSMGAKIVNTSATTYNAGTEYTITADTTSNNVTVNLPTAVGISGRMYVIKKTAAANKVIVDGATTETIDGALTYEMFSQYDWVKVQSNGTNWLIIA